MSNEEVRAYVMRYTLTSAGGTAVLLGGLAWLESMSLVLVGLFLLLPGSLGVFLVTGPAREFTVMRTDTGRRVRSEGEADSYEALRSSLDLVTASGLVLSGVGLGGLVLLVLGVLV